MLVMSKKKTFSTLKNVCCCLVLHLLRIGPASFALDQCKNDLDLNDMSDSVTVLESILSSLIINLSVCCVNELGGCLLTSLPVLTSITSSDFHP